MKICEMKAVTGLVSGGAAWADHVAPRVGLKLGLPVSIWLPANERDLEVARYYHRMFSQVLGRDTFSEVSEGTTIQKFGGFKDRNSKVAGEADVYLACTFGRGKNVKHGGTADTVRKMEARGVKGFHLDLNELKLYAR